MSASGELNHTPLQAPSVRPTGRRVAILLSGLYGRGGERASILLASELIDRGYEVDLILQHLVCDYPKDVPASTRLFFLSRSNHDEDQTKLSQLPIIPEPLTGAPAPFSVRFPRLALATALDWNQWELLISTRPTRWATAIAAYIERERPDALLAMSISPVTAAAMAVRLTDHKVRTVGVAHNVFRCKRERRRAKRSFPYMDAAVGVSLGISSELDAIPGMPKDRIHTVYNPVVAPDLIRKARLAPEHPWFNEPGPSVIVSIGVLNKQKDFHTLLGAFSRLLAQRTARLIVLGKGPLLSELKSTANKLQISDHVDFPGFVENPYAYLARARLFVLSSRDEGLGIVLIEAMACGCPVVSTDCPHGPHEILEGGRWGELVPVGDPEALAGAMVRAMDTVPRPEALRERAAFFSQEKAVRRYEELLFG